MTKAELKELCDDLMVYSGHLKCIRGIKKQKTVGGYHIIGKAVTYMADFRFMILPFIPQPEDYWVIQLEDAHESVNSGGVVYRTYTFPKLAGKPDLKQRILSANRIIEELTRARMPAEPPASKSYLSHHYEIVGMPPGLSRSERVEYCLEKVKRAHEKKREYVRN